MVHSSTNGPTMFGHIRRLAGHVKYVFTWILATATVFWSLGTSILIQVPVARAVAPVLANGGPQDGQINVPTDALVDINADRQLKSSTVTTGNVGLLECTGTTDAVSCPATTGSNLCNSVGAITDGSGNAGRRILCSLTNGTSLASSTTYKFTLTTGIQDNADSTAMAAQVDRIFRTGSASQTNSIPPNVFAFTPGPGAFDVVLNTKFRAEFSKGPEGDMKADASANAADTTANYTIKKIVNNVPTTVVAVSTAAWDSTGRVASVTGAALEASSEYEFCVKGNIINNQSQSLGMDRCARFRTGTVTDATAPTFRSANPTVPADAATGIDKFNPQIQAFFSEAMDPTTITLSNVRLCIDVNANGCDGGETRLDANTLDLRYDPGSKAAMFSLRAGLASSTKYCFEVTTGAKDDAGNAVASTLATKCFTTGSAADSAAPKIQFADADTFKVVAHFNEGLLGTDAVNAANYALQCPYNAGSGPSVNLVGVGKTLTYKPDFREAELGGLGLQPGQECRLTMHANTRDLAGNIFSVVAGENYADFKVQDPATTGGVLGFGGGQQQDFASGTNFGTFWEKPTRGQPRSQIASATSNWEIELPVPQALATGAKFLLTFPNGFNVSSAAAVSASTSWMNTDLNGPGPGITTISGVAVDATANSVTVTLAHSGTAMGATDQLRFELSGIVNPATPATDLRLSIIVKDANGIKVGQTISTAPFMIQAGGSLALSGSVYKDTDGDGAKDAGEGIDNVKVFCDSMGGFNVGSATGGMMGHQEATTADNGAWSIGSLTAGRYGCGLPPDPTNLADTGGGNQWVDVSLESVSKTGVDFKFKDLNAAGSGAQTLSVTITGTAALSGKSVDVFCHAGGFDVEFSAPVMKVVSLNGDGGGTTTMKLQGGKTYQCGAGPHVDFSAFSGGGPPPVPEFDFLPPAMQQVVVPSDSAPTALTVALIVAGNSITGTVKDGSDVAIANVFVQARPLGCFDVTTGAAKDCFGSFTQSKSDGTFTLKVAPGTYSIGANAPGMPQSAEVEVTVKTDGTVQQKGTTVATVALKMVKSSVTIAGSVQDESGNGIKYAHVNADKITEGNTCSTFTPIGGHADSPTDSSGNYTLYVSNGTWCLRAFAPSYGEVATKTVVISGGTSATGQTIKATAADFGTISGTVTKGGSAASGAFVGCHGTSGGNGASTGADGTYSIKLKAGSGYTCDGFINGAGPLTPVSSVTVTSDTTTTVNLSMGNPGTVTVTITGVSDAFVELRDSTGRGQGSSQGSAGVYTIKVPAGTYTLRGGGPRYGEICAGQSVVVTAGGTATATCTPPTNLKTVAGRVTDGSSNVEGATIRFSDSTGKSFTTSTDAKTGSDNNLSIANIPDGTYNLIVSKSGYEPATTTATVAGANLTLASAVAMTKASGASGTSVTATVTADSVAYSGNAKVIATKDGKVVSADIDKTTGTISLPLTNGTWSVKSVGDNGKQSASTNVVVAAGALSGSAPTLALSTAITGFTAKSDTENVTPKSGGLLSFTDLAISGTAPKLNIPASTLSTTDSNTGKVDMDRDATLAAVDPGTDQNFVGSYGYDITPKDATGNAIATLSGDAVTVTIPYADSDVSTAGVDESKLTFGSLDETSGAWETFSTTVDTTNNLITAQITHFSSFGVIGGASTASSASAANAVPATNIKATTDGTTVILTWTDPTGIFNAVNVMRDNNPIAGVLGGQALSAVLPGVQKYVDASVKAGTTYQYVLQTDTGRRTADSAVVTIKVEAGATATTPSPSPSPEPARPEPPSGTTPAEPAIPGVRPAIPAVPVTHPSVIRGWSCKDSGGCDAKLQLKLKGKIIMAPGRSGEAFYLNPADGRAYFLGRPEHAFNVMRFLSTGMDEANFAKLQAGNASLVTRFQGKIVLRVFKSGEAWYLPPGTKKPIFLGRPADAFRIMRELGLGVSNENLAKLDLEGEIVTSREGAAAAAPSTEPVAPTPSPEPAASSEVTGVHTSDFTLKCGNEPDRTLKAGEDTNNLRDLTRYNCIENILDVWEEELNNATTYPEAEIRKRTGATPKEVGRTNNAVQYRYDFSGNMVLRLQGDKIEGSRYQVCRYIELWDYRKAGVAKKWSVDTGQGASADCK